MSCGAACNTIYYVNNDELYKKPARDILKQFLEEMKSQSKDFREEYLGEFAELTDKDIKEIIEEDKIYLGKYGYNIVVVTTGLYDYPYDFSLPSFEYITDCCGTIHY